MDVQPAHNAATTILRCTTPITSIGDALAVVADAFEHDATGVLLDKACLPPAFFDVSTRFAGEFVQNLLNHRLQMALVIRDPAAHSAPFQRFAAEARHGRQFRTFDDEVGAIAWLEGEERGTRATTATTTGGER